MKGDVGDEMGRMTRGRKRESRMLQLYLVGNGGPWIFLEQKHNVVKFERSLWGQHKKDTKP